MTAYYNEIDPHAAQWLRNLIDAGEIAPGIVDERDIRDVKPSELAEFTQCHFFAGIGVWSHALRKAGWPDDRPVWTGSCPCQPFSQAGRGGGTSDERHLWPHWFHLIGECSPPVIFGEQVASKDGLGWLDLVQADMEGAGYAFGALDTCAAGLGAPHIRQRLYFTGAKGVADTSMRGRESCSRNSGVCRTDDGTGSTAVEFSTQGSSGRVGNAPEQPCERITGSISGTQAPLDGAGVSVDGGVSVGLEHAGAGLGGVAGSERERWGGRQGVSSGRVDDRKDAGRQKGDDGPVSVRETSHAPQRPGPTNGFWGVADWLFCRDGKWRPVEPGSFPLVDGSAFSVDSGSPFEGKSRAKMPSGVGNAIVAPQAQAFIEAVMDTIDAP